MFGEGLGGGFFFGGGWFLVGFGFGYVGRSFSIQFGLMDCFWCFSMLVKCFDGFPSIILDSLVLFFPGFWLAWMAIFSRMFSGNRHQIH